MSSDWNSEV